MGDIETLKVRNPNDPDGGHMVINKTDFREGEHELHEDNGTDKDTGYFDEQRYLRMKDAERRAEANAALVAAGPLAPAIAIPQAHSRSPHLPTSVSRTRMKPSLRTTTARS